MPPFSAARIHTTAHTVKCGACRQSVGSLAGVAWPRSSHLLRLAAIRPPGPPSTSRGLIRRGTMIYFVALQFRSPTASGIQVPRGPVLRLHRSPMTRWRCITSLRVFLLFFALNRQNHHSPFGQVIRRIRENDRALFRGLSRRSHSSSSSSVEPCPGLARVAEVARLPARIADRRRWTCSGWSFCDPGRRAGNGARPGSRAFFPVAMRTPCPARLLGHRRRHASSSLRAGVPPRYRWALEPSVPRSGRRQGPPRHANAAAQRAPG